MEHPLFHWPEAGVRVERVPTAPGRGLLSRCRVAGSGEAAGSRREQYEHPLDAGDIAERRRPEGISRAAASGGLLGRGSNRASFAKNQTRALADAGFLCASAEDEQKSSGVLR